jgi:glutamate N-acetyltransferase/amino-acid N-acetyltransferase
MMIEMLPDGGVTAAQGFLAGATYAGIKTQGLDLTILYSERPCNAAATFTTNKLKSASLLLSQQHVKNGRAQAVIVNSGNANACTAEQGMQDALEMATLVADRFGIRPEDVVIASTGVVGVAMPMEKVRAGVPKISLSPQGGHEAARGIITTDTTTKETAVKVKIGDCTITIGGMAKGSGMIHPNMATMLAFITTDAEVECGFLQAALRRAVDRSFNMITVDGDTSCSDTCLVMANGMVGNPPIGANTLGAEEFEAALTQVTAELAKAIASDGEGASKLITVTALGAVNEIDARKAARAVAGSNLLKAAVYGNDPNWGRILNAVGYSGAELVPEKADVFIADVPLMKDGRILPFDKKAVSEAMKAREVHIRVDLHLGEGTATAWGCDLTEQYVKINAEYTT